MIRRALLPAFIAVGFVYAVSAVLAFTLVRAHPSLGIAVAFDLTLTASALFWLFAVRPGHAKPAALVRVLVLGLALARLLVGISALGIVAIAIELVVIALLVARARRLVRHVRALLRYGAGLTSALDSAFRAAIPVPAVASALAMEVAMVIFAITGWFRAPPAGFAMHRKSGVLLILGVLTVLSVVEAVVLHVVLVRVTPTLAIVLTALTAYGVLWLIGFAQAVRLSPLRVTKDGLVIERGVTRRAFVPASAIVRAGPVANGHDDAVDLSYVEANVLLELSEPVQVHGLLGRTRSTTKLLLSIDERDAFFSQLAEYLDHRVVDGAAQ